MRWSSRAISPARRWLPARRLAAALALRSGFLGLLAFHLGDEFLTEPGVGGEALVELGDLGAEVFLFEFEQGFGILFFKAGNEESEESTEEVGEAAEHGFGFRLGMIGV